MQSKLVPTSLLRAMTLTDAEQRELSSRRKGLLSELLCVTVNRPGYRGGSLV